MQCCSSPESHERVRCIGLPCWIRNQDRRGPKSHRECTPTRTAWSEAHESLTLNSIPVFYMARADVRVTKSRGLRTAGFFNYLHWTIRPECKVLHECDRDCWRPTRCAYAEWFMPRAIVSPHLPTRTRPSCCGSFKVCFDIVRFSLSKRYRRPMAHPSHYIISPLTPHARPSSCARQRATLMA